MEVLLFPDLPYSVHLRAANLSLPHHQSIPKGQILGEYVCLIREEMLGVGRGGRKKGRKNLIVAGGGGGEICFKLYTYFSFLQYPLTEFLIIFCS